MESILLNVEPRAERGSANVRRLRRQGVVPAIYYGREASALDVQVSAREFSRSLGGLEGTQLVRFASPTPELDGQTVILKEVQVHPVTSDVLHVDFYAIDPTRRLRVQVPVHFEGKAEGVTAGGILQPVRREITVECLPQAIPSELLVDVSALGIHDSIHVEDIPLPEGVDAVFDTNFAIVTVLPPTVEAAPEAEAAAEGEEAAAAAPGEGEKEPEKEKGKDKE